MKRALLPLIGCVLVLTVLFSGTVYRENYVAPWDAAEGGSAAAAIRSTIEDLLMPAASRVLRFTANATDVEGTGQLVEGVEGATGGNTGAEILFPDRLYPYRAMLSEDQKAVYNQAYANAMEVNGNSFVLVRSVSEKELIDVMSALLNDQPQLFYLETRYSYGYLIDGSVVSLKLSFNSTANDLSNSKTAFASAAETILTGARQLPTAVEREQYVHDELLKICVYDQNSVNNQSAYSALVSGSSVCAGYARAFQYLMLELGIPSYYCEGTVDGGNHAWNIVELTGEYYNLDPSWNDVSSDTIGHSYFNLTDEAIGKDHVRRGLSVNLPACNAQRYSYENLYGNSAGDAGGASNVATYQSLGYSDSEVLRSLSGYYDYCKSALIKAGQGTHTLNLVIQDITLVNEIYAATKNKDYLSGYAEAVAENLGLRNCSVSLKLSAEYLADGFVLLTQTVSISGETATPTPMVTPAPQITATPTPLVTPVIITPEPSTATAEPAEPTPSEGSGDETIPTEESTPDPGIFATAQPANTAKHHTQKPMGAQGEAAAENSLE